MTSCNHESRLHLLHDGEGAPDDISALEQHVRDCPACAAELRRLRALSGLLTGAGAPNMPADALARVRGAVVARDARRLEALRVLRRLTAAAAVVLLGASALLLRHSSRPPTAHRTDGPVLVWERAAVARDPLAPGPGREQTQLAQWIVNDLARQAATPVTP